MTQLLEDEIEDAWIRGFLYGSAPHAEGRGIWAGLDEFKNEKQEEALELQARDVAARARHGNLLSKLRGLLQKLLELSPSLPKV